MQKEGERLEYKIYQDREKIADTGSINEDYRILFPETIAEAVYYKNGFAGKNTLKSVIEYLVEKKSCVVVSEDEPTDTVGDTHWMKVIGTYNNGTIGNIFLYYVLSHILRNHDGTVSTKDTENVICKADSTVYPKTKQYDGYLAESTSEVTIAERGQIVDCYYDEQQYNVFYVLNGGTNPDNNPATIYYTEEFTLENAEKEHYHFIGWYMDSDFAEKVTKLSEVPNDITLYAKFEEMEHGITYVLDGGTNSVSNPSTITYFETVQLADATKEHYSFDGWYADSAFTDKVEALSNTNEDITLHAKFNALYPDTISNLFFINVDGAVKILFNTPTECYGGTTLVYKAGGAPTSISDGTVITPFTSESTVSGLTNGTQYGFSLFNYNLSGNYKGDYVSGTYTPTSTSSGGGESGGESGGDNSGENGNDVPTTGTVYLYRNGDECVDVTGGWEVDNHGAEGTVGVALATKYSTYMEAKILNAFMEQKPSIAIGFSTKNNVIDIKKKGKYYMKYSAETETTAYGDTAICLDGSSNGLDQLALESTYYYKSSSTAMQTMSRNMGITSISDLLRSYIHMSVRGTQKPYDNGFAYYAPNASLKIYEVWVEYE